MSTTESQSEELIYAPAVIILSSDLYPRKMEIVREYIQNASDAIDSFTHIADAIGDPTEPQIKISIQGKSLLIWDNGIGMDAEEMAKLRKIAYSEKREGEAAGYKGIGRLAGIAVAGKLWISSTSYGDPTLHKFEFRAKEFVEDTAERKASGHQEPASSAIKRHTALTAYDVDPQEHYTLVELRDIDDSYPELLDPDRLREFIGEIAPVGFAPDFTYGAQISDKLEQFVSNYAPKAVWLTTGAGDRMQVYKPYNNAMELSEPEFVEVSDPNDGQRLLAYLWHSTRGKRILERNRPIGNKFVVPGNSQEEKKRYAGLAYKLFGFSIGDRSLPLRTLWKKDYTRPLWFTGEIHIVDKGIKPTTDRSDFVDNEARRSLYSAGERVIAKRLNKRAQEISDNRQAYDSSEKWRERFRDLESKLNNGGVERAELKLRKEELHNALHELTQKGKCNDRDIRRHAELVANQGRALQRRLEDAKIRKDRTNQISDLPQELHMTSQARKVYMVIMETLEQFFREDKDTYYDLSEQIKHALRKKL